MIADIINEINSHIIDVSPKENLSVHGLCRLMIKTNQPHPVTDDGNKQVSIDSRYDGLIYHRIISTGDVNEKEDFMFGKSIPKEISVRVRTVVANKKALTEGFKYEIAQRIPERLVLPGYKYIDIDGTINVIEDDESVYNAEFGSGDYEKRTEPYIISALEYSIKFIRC